MQAGMAGFLYPQLMKDVSPPLIVLCPLIFVLPIIFLYHQLTKRIPSCLRPDQAPKTSFGIVQVDGFASSVTRHGVDLIFVHGLGSNPDTTWCAATKVAEVIVGEAEVTNAQKNFGRTTCWIRDFLPYDIPEASRQNTRVFLYNHDTHWQRDAVKTRLVSLGRNMLHAISSKVRMTEEEQSRDLIFVAYSYGGLIVKRALVQAKNHDTYMKIHQHTKGVLFLGTPHLGSSMTRLGSIFAKVLQPLGSDQSIILELAYDSAPLRDLHQDFVDASANEFRVVNFYEERRTRLIKFWVLSWNEFFVKEQSATYAGSKNVEKVGFSVDHYGLNKFGWRSPAYKSILSELCQLMVPLRQSLYSVPPRTVSSFTPRDELSSSISDSLRNIPSTDTDVPRILVIHGRGGIGKTQLALKYVEGHKGEFSPILWIDAESQDTIRASFERCASHLGVSINRTSGQIVKLRDAPAIQSVLKWFQQQNEPNSEWLVVIDNADDTSDWNIEDIIPHGANGNVIITSQHPQTPKLLKRQCAKIEVKEMNRTEASNLLLQDFERDLQSLPSDVGKAVDIILDQLDGFALAIDLARAYLVLQSDYVAALKQYSFDVVQHQHELLSYEPFCNVSPYKKTVWTVWDTTLDAIDKRYPELNASLLLTFLAHLDRGNVQDELFLRANRGFPELPKSLHKKYENLPEWFRKWIAVDGPKWDSFHYRKSIEPLIRYGLLQPVEGDWPGVTMHGLVQWRAKKQCLDQPFADCLSAFITAVAHQINQERGRPQFRRYVIPHIAAVRHHALDQRPHRADLDEYIIDSWRILANVFHYEGQWTEAEKLGLQVMEAKKQMLGIEHPDTLSTMHNLALTYLKQGRWSEAEDLQLQVIEARKQILGIEHPDTLSTMHTLASIYAEQERWSEAEELQLQVMEAEKQIFGSEHPDTLTSMNNLASIYAEQERWSEAERLNMQAMEARKRVLGSEHPSTLTSMNNLAYVWKSQGRVQQALNLMSECVEVRERKLGGNYPDTAASRRALMRWKAEQTS